MILISIIIADMATKWVNLMGRRRTKCGAKDRGAALGLAGSDRG